MRQKGGAGGGKESMADNEFYRSLPMIRPTEIHLFGSLRKKDADRPIRLDLGCSGSLMDIIDALQIDPDSVQLAMVNYRAVPRNWTVSPGDRVSLFPKEYPIFADWKDFRFK